MIVRKINDGFLVIGFINTFVFGNEINVKAKDTDGAESSWTDSLSVSMPKNNPSTNPLFIPIIHV